MQTTWQKMTWMTIALILLACAPPACAQNTKQPPLNETVSQSWAQLIAASQDYRASLVRVLELQEQAQMRAAELVEKQKLLLAQGAIAKRELEAGEQALHAAQMRTNEARQQLEAVEQLIAEANATELWARQPAELPSRSPRYLLNREKAPAESQGNYRSALIRYAGTSAWALSDFGKVEAFFRTQFGKPLTVSAYGQSATHNRLGFDHRAAIDVALHPDSHEGQRLTAYLREHGIPFIAIRCPIPGSATGAHIHIGPPSKRAAVP